MESRDGTVALPRLRLRSKLELSGALKALGLGPAFVPGTDFEDLFEGPGYKSLSRVLHGARVDLDEQGTRAAAVTVVTARAVSMPLDPPPPFDLRLDRPFLRRDGKLVPATWNEAFAAIASLKPGNSIAAMAGDLVDSPAEPVRVVASVVQLHRRPHLGEARRLDCAASGERVTITHLVAKAIVPQSRLRLPTTDDAGLRATYSWKAGDQQKTIAQVDPNVEFAWTSGRLTLSGDPSFQRFGSDSFEERGKVTEEYLRIVRRLFVDDRVTVKGAYRSLREAEMYPKPAPGDLPLWLHGSGPLGIRRAARFADGWIAGSPLPAEFRASYEAFQRERDGKPPASVAVSLRVDRARRQEGAEETDHGFVHRGSAADVVRTLTAFASAGVTHFLLTFPAESVDELVDKMMWFASDVAPRVTSSSGELTRTE